MILRDYYMYATARYKLYMMVCGERMAKEFRKDHSIMKSINHNDTPHDQKKVTYFKTSGEMLAAFVTPKLLGIPNSCCTGTSLVPKDMFDSLVENIVDKS